LRRTSKWAATAPNSRANTCGLRQTWNVHRPSWPQLLTARTHLLAAVGFVGSWSDCSRVLEAVERGDRPCGPAVGSGAAA